MQAPHYRDTRLSALAHSEWPEWVESGRTRRSAIGHQLTLADANWVSASDPLR
jgi:hypothetical protein